MAWAGQYENIISNLLCNSDWTVIQNNFLLCFNVFIGCWRARPTATSIVIYIFSGMLKPIIPQLNLCSAYRRLAKCHNQHFKCPCTFNFIFYTKLNTISGINFFRLIKNRRAHQNTTNRFICQKQTHNPKWPILSTYITDMCTNITENENAKVDYT